MIHDFKLTIINFLVIAFAFTNIETILKPIALSLTIATVALFRDKLDGDHWVILATVYIGMEAATNIVERLKTNG